MEYFDYTSFLPNWFLVENIVACALFTVC